MFAHPIVLNEWIIHDIQGDNGLKCQQEAEIFLETFSNSNDRIVVLRESPWMRKMWHLWTTDDVRVQILSKLFFNVILLNPLKATLLFPEDVQPLPPGLAEQVPEDDAYLFQTAIGGTAGIVVTTDGRLITNVTRAGQFGLELMMRNKFYARYLNA